MQVPDSPALLGVEGLIISASGYGILKRTSTLMVFDLKESRSSSPETVASGPIVIAPIELLSAGKGYHFSEISFSPSGDALYAWCYGKDIIICCWRFGVISRGVGAPYYYPIYLVRPPSYLGCF